MDDHKIYLTGHGEMFRVIKARKLVVDSKYSRIVFSTLHFNQGIYKVYLAPHRKEVGKHAIFIQCNAVEEGPCDKCFGKEDKIFNQKNFKKQVTIVHDKFLTGITDELGSSEEDEGVLVTPDKGENELVVPEQEGDELVVPEKEGDELVVPAVKVGAKRQREQNMKTLCTELVVANCRSIMLRIEQLEKHLAKIDKNLDRRGARKYKQQEVDVEGGMGVGVCAHCKKSYKDEELKLRPYYVPLVVHSAYAGARSLPSTEFKKTYCRNNRHCSACKDDLLVHKFIDINNYRRMCMLCRCVTNKKSGFCCADCDCDGMQKNHAVHKKPIHETFKMLKSVVFEIETVETSYLCQNGEYGVGEAGSIDFVVQIKLKTGERFLYVIEILSTKTEDIFLYSTKFLSAYDKIKPTKAFMIALDICNRTGEPPLPCRLDILRRWVIFTVLYHKHLPSITNWWFFCDQRNAYRSDVPQATRFYREPIMINAAPLPLEGEGMDWEFASDAYAGDFDHKTVNVNELLFGNVFQRDIFTSWAKYNVDKEEGVGGPLVHLELKRPTSS